MSRTNEIRTVYLKNKYAFRSLDVNERDTVTKYTVPCILYRYVFDVFVFILDAVLNAYVSAAL